MKSRLKVFPSLAAATNGTDRKRRGQFNQNRISLMMGCWLAPLMLGCWAMQAQVARPRLEILRTNLDNAPIRLSTAAQSNTVFTLEASPNLARWTNIGVFHDAVAAYPDLASKGRSERYYRLTAARRQAVNDWKNQLVFPVGEFGSTTRFEDTVAWVKFAIVPGDPARVYYEDTQKYPLHYDFATLRLDAFKGMDHSAFESASLHRASRQIILGTLFYSPSAGYAPELTGKFIDCGLQFDSLDPCTPDEIALWFEWVKATTSARNEISFTYIPSFEQSKTVLEQRDAYEQRGITISSLDHWTIVNACYSPGWAVGRLKFFTAAEIRNAYADGRLTANDILLTDGVPADTPIVSGILTLNAATPNSHTAILAQSLGAPFGFVQNAAAQACIRSLDGRKVLLKISSMPGKKQIDVIDAEGLFAPAFEAELLALKTEGRIQYAAKKELGSMWASTDKLTPSDIQYFGGKAANYGILRQSTPDHCPLAVAFSFDLWDAFLDQILSGGKPLRSEISARLAGFTAYPPDMAVLKPALASARDLFTTQAEFSAAQREAITNALAIFDPKRKIRFRSSTNVEDTDRFTGAGLYDSFSGCLSDDQDADSSGPCQCDASDAKERGVFQAIKKVYASFYNDDAYAARLMHQVDESKAGMGILVHHSFPDADELANGVATPRYDFSSGSASFEGEMVTQLGAESVTNPDGASLPEVAGMSSAGYYAALTLKQGSSLVPVGDHVMNWQADYQGFVEIFAKAAQGFRQYYPAKKSVILDFEYKKDARLGLVVKQVRQLPQPASAAATTAFLIDKPVVLEPSQYGSSFASHRLKSLWSLHSPNVRLYATNLAGGVFSQGVLEYLNEGALQKLDGLLSSWPGFSCTPDGASYTWTTGSGESRRDWQLAVSLKTTVSGGQAPIYTLADFQMSATVAYAAPQLRMSGEYQTNTLSDAIWLQVHNDDVSNSVLQERKITSPNGVVIQTTYYWPQNPALAIYTPLQKFVQTRITGLTSSPIVLTNYYSQTYGAFSHNYMEEFLFEPRLEPGLPQALLAELDAAGIQWIYVTVSGGRAGFFFVIDKDGRARRLL